MKRTYLALALALVSPVLPLASPATIGRLLLDSSGTSLVQFAQRLYRIGDTSDIMQKSQGSPSHIAETIRTHIASLRISLGLPSHSGTLHLPGSREAELRRAIEDLIVAESDSVLKERSLAFLDMSPDGFTSDKDVGRFYGFLGDMVRLVYRSFVGRIPDGYLLFPFPMNHWKYGEFVAFRRLDKRFAKIIGYVPNSRPELENLFQEKLPRLGFGNPDPRKMAEISTEELACWMLVLRMRELGNRQMRRLASALLDTMAAGDEKDFFDTANQNNLYSLAFELDYSTGSMMRFFTGDGYEWQLITSTGEVNRSAAVWTESLERVLEERREEPHRSFAGAADSLFQSYGLLDMQPYWGSLFRNPIP